MVSDPLPCIFSFVTLSGYITKETGLNPNFLMYEERTPTGPSGSRVTGTKWI